MTPALRPLAPSGLRRRNALRAPLAMRDDARRRGFTLIELLVVIIIIAVVAGTIVPGYSRLWARSRFQSAVQEVRALFALARERAVANDSSVIVTFNPQEQSLTVVSAPTLPVVDQPAIFQADAQTMQAAMATPNAPMGTRLGEEFMITNFTVGGAEAGGLSLRFRGDGTCDGAQLTLGSDSGYGAVITVWPATGRTTADEGQ